MRDDCIKKDFCDVVACKRCTNHDSKNLLRDDRKNIPQPGFVDKNYEKYRILFVGQNPGIPSTDDRSCKDQKYTQSIRELAKEWNVESYQNFYQLTIDFMGDWPIYKRHFQFHEVGLTLDDIAYCNVVRCRTKNNAALSKTLIHNCSEHFRASIETLKPRLIIFIGKAAYKAALDQLPDTVKSEYINRQRSLSNIERNENRQRVVDLIKSFMT